jgi:hypothetical protein
MGGPNVCFRAEGEIATFIAGTDKLLRAASVGEAILHS